MYQQLIRGGKFFLLFISLSVAFVACEKDKTNNNITPAKIISESENLVIPAAVEIPANPGGNTRVVTFYAEGVQKYKAQENAGSSPVTYSWVFVAPEAKLYDATNSQVGTHSAGPTWQVFGPVMDSIYGQAFSPAKTAVSPDANSIDWLLLKPKDAKAPTGIFANVSYIQRIATSGGKAPSIPPVTANETVNVNYTAIYRFTKKNP